MGAGLQVKAISAYTADPGTCGPRTFLAQRVTAFPGVARDLTDRAMDGPTNSLGADSDAQANPPRVLILSHAHSHTDVRDKLRQV
jgi:hypothetical protein